MLNKYKFLGVFVDENLSWDYHIHLLCNQLSKINGLLSKLKHIFPKKILLMIYCALFLSRLNYCSTAWGFGSCDRLEIIQKKAIRNINNSPLLSHTKPICKSLNLLLFKDLFTLNCLKIYYKFQNSMIPKYFIDIELVKKYQPIFTWNT